MRCKGEDVTYSLGGRLAKFNVRTEDVSCGNSNVSRQGGRSVRRDLQSGIPRKTETAEDARDGSLGVDRQNGKVVSSLVSHASGETNLDVVLGSTDAGQGLGRNDNGLLDILAKSRLARVANLDSEARGTGVVGAILAAKLLFQGSPERLVLPGLEITEHVTISGISAFKRQDALATKFSESGVNELGDAMEGLGPVVVTTAEYGIVDALHLLALKGLNPVDETSGVRRRLALVRSSHNDNGSVLGQALVGRVQGADGGTETVLSSIGGQALSQSLAGTAVGSVVDGHGLALASGNCGSGSSLLLLGVASRLASQLLFKLSGRQVVTQANAHLEVLGLDGEGLLELKVVVGVVHGEVEVLEQNSHGEKGLLPSEGAADTGTLSVTERLPAVRELLVQASKVLVRHAVGVELLSVLAEDNGVEVGAGQESDNGFILVDHVFASEESVLIGLDRESSDGRGESQSFAENL